MAKSTVYVILHDPQRPVLASVNAVQVSKGDHVRVLAVNDAHTDLGIETGMTLEVQTVFEQQAHPADSSRKIQALGVRIRI